MITVLGGPFLTPADVQEIDWFWPNALTALAELPERGTTQGLFGGSSHSLCFEAIDGRRPLLSEVDGRDRRLRRIAVDRQAFEQAFADAGQAFLTWSGDPHALDLPNRIRQRHQ